MGNGRRGGSRTHARGGGEQRLSGRISRSATSAAMAGRSSAVGKKKTEKLCIGTLGARPLRPYVPGADAVFSCSSRANNFDPATAVPLSSARLRATVTRPSRRRAGRAAANQYDRAPPPPQR